MLVSHRFKFIFLKPGKTAGTSVEVFLEPLCTPPGHVPTHGLTSPIISEHGIVGVRSSNAKDINQFYNHIRAKDLKKLLSDELWESYLKVATVRNPFDMVVSKFHHFILDKEIAKKLTKEEVVQRFRKWIEDANPGALRNGSFVMVDGKSCLDRQIRYERLEADVGNFVGEIGANISELGEFPSLKRDTRLMDIMLYEYYDSDTVKILVNKAEGDFKIFGYDTSL